VSVPITVTGASGTLAATGAQVAGVISLAIGLLGSGVALVLYRRRGFSRPGGKLQG
jgi:LPXTG-motif cell wall-anchored protein